MLKRFSRAVSASGKIAAVAILAATFVLPAATATADHNGPGLFVYGSSPRDVATRWVWSRYEHDSHNHGSSAYGDRWGLIRSTCKAPGVRAYAESVYSIVGGDRTSYYRYC